MAIDAGFFKWTQNPHRMVGFDGRPHSFIANGDSETWKYNTGTKEANRTNRYSMTLTKFAFLHRDYLKWYTSDLPRPIFDRVAEIFNCEDIAMSFFISSLTNGQPPLLADTWASLTTYVSLYEPNGGISDSSSHATLRDACVNDFAELLFLKGRLQYGRYKGPDIFSFGDDPQYEVSIPRETDDTNITGIRNARQRAFDAMRTSWQAMTSDAVKEELTDIKDSARKVALRNGLIAHSGPWAKRWNSKRRHIRQI